MTTIKASASSIFSIHPPASHQELEDVELAISLIGNHLSEAQLILSNFSTCGEACDHNHSQFLEKPLEEFLNNLSKEERQTFVKNILIKISRKEITTIEDIENLLKTKNKPQASRICTTQQWKEIHAGKYTCVRPECHGECGKPYKPEYANEQIKKTPFNIKKHWPKFAAGLGLALAGFLAYLALSNNSQSNASNSSGGEDLTNLFSSLALSSSLPANTKASTLLNSAPNNGLTSLQLTNFAISPTS